MVGNKSVTVFRDTGCSGVIVKRDLVAEEQLTGKVGYIITVARTLLKAPFANVEINTPYYSGRVEALCLFLTHVESATATETKLFRNSCTVKRNSQIVQSNYLI